MFRPISLWLALQWEWHDPNETPAFPRWQWMMLLHSAGAGGTRRSLFCSVGWAEPTDMHTGAHPPFAPIPTPRLSCPLSRKFWHKQLLSAQEWQVYSRFQQAHQRGAGWWSCGITTRVEAVLQTCWAACLPAFPFVCPGGFFRRAPSLSLTVYTSLGFVHLISAVGFRQISP